MASSHTHTHTQTHENIFPPMMQNVDNEPSDERNIYNAIICENEQGNHGKILNSK